VPGGSSDSVDSPARLHKKNALPFGLLSDKHARLLVAFGGPPTLGLIPRRVTRVVDTEGVIWCSCNFQLDAGKDTSEWLAFSPSSTKRETFKREQSSCAALLSEPCPGRRVWLEPIHAKRADNSVGSLSVAPV